jgi:hypothetical protein
MEDVVTGQLDVQVPSTTSTESALTALWGVLGARLGRPLSSIILGEVVGVVWRDRGLWWSGALRRLRSRPHPIEQ